MVTSPRRIVDPAVLGLLGSLGFGFFGVVEVAGVVHGPVDLRVGAPVRDGGDVLVDEPGSVLGQDDGPGGDLAGLPHRHLAGHTRFQSRGSR